jgi:hypothetical protein
MFPTRLLSARIGHVLLLACVWLLLRSPALVLAQHGCDPGNLIPNCDFNAFTGSPPRQVPEGFAPFILSGDVEFRGVSGSESHSWYGASSLLMTSGNPYVAGIYTQVSGLQPGVAYKASIGLGAPAHPTATFGRQLGIDPTGGTDPTAPTVIWGHEHWGDARGLNYPPPDVNIDVSAIAKSPTVTVFVKVNHNAPVFNSLIYLDALSLQVDSSIPTAVPEPPTNTPAPPKPRPTAVPTDTPQPTTTPTATYTATPTPTFTATTTPSITPTPTQTYTPTPLPTSTLPPRPRATPGEPVAATPARSAPQGLLFGGLAALAGAGILGAIRVVGRGRPLS